MEKYTIIKLSHKSIKANGHHEALDKVMGSEDWDDESSAAIPFESFDESKVTDLVTLVCKKSEEEIIKGTGKSISEEMIEIRAKGWAEHLSKLRMTRELTATEACMLNWLSEDFDC